ncbi:MAG: DUF6682 family protein [Pararobbsia sp.]
MTTTCQTVIDRARIPLNDAGKTRYTDAALLSYLGDGIAEAYSLRPDLRFGSFTTNPVTLFELTDTFPLPVQHEVALQHYIIYRAENMDDENVNENREQKSFQMFERGILKT